MPKTESTIITQDERQRNIFKELEGILQFAVELNLVK